MDRKRAQNGRRAQDEAPCQDTPVSATLLAVASEISDLATLCDRLQPFIGAGLIADGAANPDDIREIQALDLLVQRLNGVAAFVRALAESAPKAWHIDAEDAASHVVLADLARRLSCNTRQENPLVQAEASLSGNFELFG